MKLFADLVVLSSRGLKCSKWVSIYSISSIFPPKQHFLRECFLPTLSQHYFFFFLIWPLTRTYVNKLVVRDIFKLSCIRSEPTLCRESYMWNCSNDTTQIMYKALFYIFHCFFSREVFKAKHRQTGEKVALKKVLMENEKEGVRDDLALLFLGKVWGF